MNRIFIDTNVLLDVLARREPHYAPAAEVWTLCEEGKLKGSISAISFNNIFYIVRKLSGKKAARQTMEILRDVFEPVALDAQIIHQSSDAGFGDFEDAIQFHSAVRAGADALITRNAGHFPKTKISIVSPKEFLAARGMN